MGDFGADLTHIALFGMSIALVTLLINKPQAFVSDVKAVGGVYNGVLSTLTLQSQVGNPFS